MPKIKTNPFILWWYKLFHLNDDWGVCVTDMYSREVIVSFGTPWVIKAFCRFILYNFKYSQHNVILTHYRYPEV